VRRIFVTMLSRNSVIKVLQGTSNVLQCSFAVHAQVPENIAIMIVRIAALIHEAACYISNLEQMQGLYIESICILKDVIIFVPSLPSETVNNLNTDIKYLQDSRIELDTVMIKCTMEKDDATKRFRELNI